MNIINDNNEKRKRYLPHELHIRENAVKTYRNGNSISYVCRKYHISRTSLYRWNKEYDGTKESLQNKSHKPLSKHSNAHTDEEITWIKNLIRRNPDITLCELWYKLRIKRGYSRHIGRLYRVLKRLDFYQEKNIKNTSKYVPKKYNTPKQLGIKWQIDVKFVPEACIVGDAAGQKFYQYTMIEEASRKRFIYAYEENSSYSTIDFVKRAITFFGYAPKTIQTDNGAEFTHFFNTKRVHPFDVFCNRYKIEHKLIRPRTPWHNGKVERSHRNDQERFYNHLSFYSFADLQEQMKRYLRRSNSIPMAVLGWKSPNQKQLELENTCA